MYTERTRMFDLKPPLRLAIALLLCHEEAYTAAGVHAALLPQYTGERQFTLQALEEHLQALKAVGIVRIAEEHLDEAGTLIQSYALTPYGRSRINAFL